MAYEPVYAEDETSKEPKILYYRNPMNPAITSPVPAKDAMDMDYLPVYADADASVAMQPVLSKSMPSPCKTWACGLQLPKRPCFRMWCEPSGEWPMMKSISCACILKRKAGLKPCASIKPVQWVKKNEDLLSIYSPQLVTSQQEYLLALNDLKDIAKSPIEDIRRGAEELVKSSRERLETAGCPCASTA